MRLDSAISSERLRFTLRWVRASWSNFLPESSGGQHCTLNERRLSLYSINGKNEKASKIKKSICGGAGVQGKKTNEWGRTQGKKQEKHQPRIRVMMERGKKRKKGVVVVYFFCLYIMYSLSEWVKYSTEALRYARICDAGPLITSWNGKLLFFPLLPHDFLSFLTYPSPSHLFCF